MASANLRYRVNGGAVQSTSAEVASGDTIALLATSYAGWATPAARWEIVAYPPGWSVPAGWSTDAANGRYYYLANSGGSGVVPPNVTIPNPATTWGKWTFRLTVNGSIVSEDLSVETLSPALGLHDLAFGEGRQFGGTRSYIGPHQENLRTVDAAALASGGFVSALAATAPIHVNASTGSVTITWAPTGDVSMSSHKLTNVTDPTSAQDAATKAYVDAVAAGLDPKQSVFVASTASVTLSGTQTVDGVSVTAGKRVLVKDQGSSANGIYLSAAGSWTRTTDLAAGASAAGAYCFVEQGTTNGDKGFVCTNNTGSDVVGTDTLAFTQFTGAAGGLDATTAVLENASTALNANGIPIQALGSQLTFVGTALAPIKSTHKAASSGTVVEALRVTQQIGSGTAGAGGEGVRLALSLPDGLGADTVAATWRAQSTTVLGGLTAKQVWATVTAGTATDRMTLSAPGVLDVPAGLTSASLDASSAGALTLGGTTATSVACSGLPLTGVASIDNSASTITVGANTTSQTIGKAATVCTFPGSITVATIDNSGSSLTIGANTTGQTIGKSGTTAAIAGAATIASTLGVSDAVSVNKDNITTTATRAITVFNATNSGTQYAGQVGWSAYRSGTIVNAALQWEPQSTSRGILRLMTGTGASAPSSNSSTYWDQQDSNFGEGWFSSGFYCSGIIVGFRFNTSSNRGGMDLDGSNNLRLKSYSGAGFLVSLYSDGGSTLTSNPISVNGSGQGYARFIRAAPTSSGAAVTFNLATSQNIEHAVTEATTVSFTGAAAGMSGHLVFTQDSVTGRTVTMPTNGDGIEYDASIWALTTTGIVSATNNTRTVLAYYVLSNVANRIYVYARSVSTIP